MSTERGYKIGATLRSKHFNTRLRGEETYYYKRVNNIEIGLIKGDNGFYYLLVDVMKDTAQLLKKFVQQDARVNLSDEEKADLIKIKNGLITLRNSKTPENFNLTPEI